MQEQKVYTRPKIFEEQIARKPDYYPWAKEFSKSMHDGHWTADKFDFAPDAHAFKTKLNNDERECLVRALSAIGQIEIAVKKFWAKLGDNCPHPSLTDLGYVLANIEVIHNEAYEKLLVVLGLEDIFEKNLKLDVVSNRVNYLRKYNHKYYTDNKKQYVYALILFSLFVENVSLFSEFYIAMWFAKEKNAFHKVSTMLDFTRKEETIHALVGIKLVQTIKEEYPELFDEGLKERVLHECEEAFKSECKIIAWILETMPEHAELNQNVLENYIKNRFNDSLKLIGFPKAFENVDEEALKQTMWMEEKTLGDTMTDFFHKNPTEYANGGISYDATSLFDE